jgi:dolichyl-phosphate beta-glucosyltransferase
VLISIVIPAYNEEERLPVMLDATLASIAKHRKKIVELAQTKSGTKSTAFEWVVVSDGSTDGTVRVVETYGRKTLGAAADVWKIVTLHTNSGKGEAVRTGMLAAQGALRLMVDADGATEFDAIMKVLDQKDAPVVFGSRAHLASQAQRSFVRTMLMYAFHFCVDLLVGSNIRDTQCGFKLFTEDAANVLFGNLHLQRWAFDIEVVVLARELSLDIAEVGVSWQEVEGSKLDSSKLQLALVAIGMLRDMLCVRLCYASGIWRIETAPQEKKVQ